MPSKDYLMLRGAPFETPPAAAPQDKLAGLEARTASLQLLIGAPRRAEWLRTVALQRRGGSR